MTAVGCRRADERASRWASPDGRATPSCRQASARSLRILDRQGVACGSHFIPEELDQRLLVPALEDQLRQESRRSRPLPRLLFQQPLAPTCRRAASPVVRRPWSVGGSERVAGLPVSPQLFTTRLIGDGVLVIPFG